MQITLVVPIRNEEETISALIDSILRQTRQPDEVLLVDGGSTDKTVERARSLIDGDSRFEVIEAGDATPGRGRNVGISAASFDWIALTDAGIRLEPTWLERLVKAAESEPGVQVVYGNYEPVRESLFESLAALAYVSPKQERGRGLQRGPFIASSLIRREVWQLVGGFPDLRAAEDLIFMERIREHGYLTAWAADATVRWKLQPTLARTFRKFVLYSKHNVWAGRQWDWHYGILRQYLFMLFFVALALVHSFWWLVVPVLFFLLRVVRRINAHREGRSLLWLLNPLRVVGVGLVLLTIDVATFVGWAQAAWQRPAQAAGAQTVTKT
jgi:glycosyltransferase involved in cell wall biosynthesis